MTWDTCDKAILWHPFTQMKVWNDQPQLTIESGEGIFLIDTEGKSYYDGVSSLWVNIHGHRRKEIDDAIKEQLDKIAHTTMLGLISIPAVQYGEALLEKAPAGLTRIFYSDDGSTAVEAALKICFQYWRNNGRPQKNKFITIESAYHGDTLGTVSVGGIDLFHRTFSTLLFEAHKIPCPSCYHCQRVADFEKKKCQLVCLQQLEELLERHSDQIAGLIIEPIFQAAAGMLLQPKGYLAKIRQLTAKYDVLLIADEVAVGFGRTGKLFACEHEGVSPDLLCLSKGITGGYLALGATLATEKIYEAFLGELVEEKTFYHGHSYTGNPLACAAALASLKLFDKDQVFIKFPEKEKAMEQGLKKIAKNLSVANIRHLGLIAGIELSIENGSDAGTICRSCRDHGLIVRNIGNVIILMPPLVSTPDEISQMMKILEESLREEKVSDFIGVESCAF